jgi:hypothetical protein
MNFSIVDPNTGFVIGHYHCSDDLAPYVQKNRSDLIAGHYEIGQYKVDQGVVMPMTSADKNDSILLGITVRNQRNYLVKELDQINTMWYNSLDEDAKTQLANYRRDLLDLPQQPSFPDNVTWPVKPTWFNPIQ